MIKLQTIVDTKPSERKIGYEDKILMLGSCFSDEIGEQMKQRNMSVTCNPFGTLYNPLSIANAIHSSFVHCTSCIVHHEGLWHSMMHHGSFSRPTREEAEEAVKASIETMQTALQEATVVIVTFGTAWVYEMNLTAERSNSETVIQRSGPTAEGGHIIVSNCHKLPADRFTRRRLTVEEIVAAWQPIIERYPDKHWIFTVSPIRHVKDGLHENQLSKATLLMAIEHLTAEGGLTVERSYSGAVIQRSVQYFEAFEILLDELRDYRFYKEDMLHPSAQTVEYIWERLAELYLSPLAKQFVQDWKPIKAALHHKPFSPEREDYKSFLVQAQEKEKTLIARYNNMV